MVAPAIDPGALARAVPQLWFESQAVIRLPNGKFSKPGGLRANVLQRRIFALQQARRRAGRPCFCIGLKPRKRGFSTAVAAINYTEMARAAKEGVIVGNKLETSDTVYRMLATMAERDGFAKAGKWGSATRAGAEAMSWAHGSRVGQSTAHGKESIRGQTPQFVHGTEVAHWEMEDDVFLALMNAVPDDSGVCVFLESTPKGRGGAFHARWEQARWPKPEECPDGQADYWKQWEARCPDQPDAVFSDYEFVRVFAAWFEFDDSALVKDWTPEQEAYIRGTLDSKSWYDGEKALLAAYGNELNGVTRLGKEVDGVNAWQQLAWRRMTIQAKCGSDPMKFAQEYPSDPASCFLASGRGVFDSDAIEHYLQQALEPAYGTLDSNVDSNVADKRGERVTWRAAHRDEAIVWKWEDPRAGCRYLIALDTAEGDDQAGGRDPDSHSCLVLRQAYTAGDGTFHQARIVARLRPPCRVPIPVLVELVHRLHLYFQALVLPEMNGSGLAYITGAQIRGTPIWKRVDFNPRSGKKEEKLGWRTTDGSDYGGIRTVIIESLGAVLRDRGIDINCSHVVRELSTFVEKNGGRREAEKGQHDDDVLALAFGLYKLDAATAYTMDAVPRRLPPDYYLGAPEDKTPSAQAW